MNERVGQPKHGTFPIFSGLWISFFFNPPLSLSQQTLQIGMARLSSRLLQNGTSSVQAETPPPPPKWAAVQDAGQLCVEIASGIRPKPLSEYWGGALTR